VKIMRKSFTRVSGPVAVALVAMLGAPTDVRAGEPITGQESHDIGVDAYVYLDSLVTMDIMRRQLTHMAPEKVPLHEPMNMFANVSAYPSAGLSSQPAMRRVAFTPI
jgi:hypothetical protein